MKSMSINGKSWLSTEARAQNSILERLLRGLLEEKIIDPLRCAENGLYINIVVNCAGRVSFEETSVAPVTVRFSEGKYSSLHTISHPIELLDELMKRDLLDYGKARTDWVILREEIENSLVNLKHALDAESQRAQEVQKRYPHFNDKMPFSSLVETLTDDKSGHWVLAAFEQLFVDGHPLTPSGKVRFGMASDDAASYGPEFVQQLEMQFVAGHKDFIEIEDGTADVSEGKVLQAKGSTDFFQKIIQTFCIDEASKSTVLQEFQTLGKMPDDYALIPVHPHQMFHTIPKLHAYAILKHILLPLKVSCVARPLMNYRTLAVKNNSKKIGLHVKTALEVQLTGAIRGVSTASARNAPRMSRLLQQIIKRNLYLQRKDSLGRELFIPERTLASIAFKGSLRSLAAVLREDIENGTGSDEIALPIASLFARSPLTGNTILTDLLKEMNVSLVTWLQALAELVIPPLLVILSEYGIALEPHPQNLVIILQNGWPHRFTVRDFGGVRIIQSRLAKHGLSVDLDVSTGLLIENASPLEAAASLRSKLFYSLFGNTFRELISALTAIDKTQEINLWEIVRTVIGQAARHIGTQEASQDAHSLLAEPWQRKCLIRMRLVGTVTEEQYIDSPNPFKNWLTIPQSDIHDLNGTEQKLFEYIYQAEPALCKLWLQEIPAARASILKDLEAALERENIQEGATVIMGLQPAWENLRNELEDSATNLALSRVLVKQRSQQLKERSIASESTFFIFEKLFSPSDIPIELDSFNAEGHPVHPCRRTKLGFSPADSVSYSHEAGQPISAKIVAIRHDHTVQSNNYTEVLHQHYPFIVDAAVEALRRRGYDPNRFQFSVAHAFQFNSVIPRIYREEIANGIIVLLPEVTLACRPTSSTRTLVTVAPGVLGKRLTIKTAIEVYITSTIRTISSENVRNSPYISHLLSRLLRDIPKVSCVLERAGIAFTDQNASGSSCTDGQRARGLSSILRDDLADYAERDEVIVGCDALITVSPISGQLLILELVSIGDSKGSRTAAANFLDTYSGLLLSGTLPLLWKYGIALEAHLQNTLLVLKQQKPRRLLHRDFGGICINRDRLAEAAERIEDIPCPHAKTITDDASEMYRVFAHSVIFSNLKQVIKALTSCSTLMLTEAHAWSIVRRQILAIYHKFNGSSDPRSNVVCHASEHLKSLFHSPMIPQKAFVTMRLLSNVNYREYYFLHRNPLCEFASSN